MLQSVWDTLKKKKRKKQRPFGLLCGSWSKNRELKHREFQPFLCEFQSEQVTQKRELQLRGEVRKIERNTVSVREWKRKRRHFFFTQVTHKEDKLVVFLWSFWVLQPWRVGVFRGRFYYWLCGEIVFTPWDLFIVYPIYCGFKFSINLIVVISIS